ncbi:hypothetical protein AYK26_00090 [Euryarchaeota archaeon SM23-78]|nr:MAG: hypothetical protein AYK26_00090 [Euryarchaeota archaeon SM23-78]MBW3000523.1 nucleotidyltransferase domain-containing protein [Candidatus Woesearchaeota archaeon]
MLDIFNKLGLFFEDCYREVNVREYARIIRISPPTASTALQRLEKEGLLKSRIERKNHLYRANRENPVFIDLSKAYWRQKLTGLTTFLAEKINYKTIILFGSLTKAEATSNSDIDLYIDYEEKPISLDEFEKKLRRRIQLHFRNELKNINLKKNIQQGMVLNGVMI